MLSRSVWSTLPSPSIILENDMLYFTVVSNFVLSFWQIQNQLNKALDDMSASLCTLKEGMSYTKQLPSKGLSQSQVLDKIREYETLSKSSFIPELHGSWTVQRTPWRVFLVFITDDWKFVAFFFHTEKKCVWEKRRCLKRRCVVADEVQWEKGCVSGAVYWGDESLTNLLVKVCIFVHISGLPSTNSQGWTWTHFGVGYSKRDWVFFVFFELQLLFVPLKEATAALICVSVHNSQ